MLTSAVLTVVLAATPLPGAVAEEDQATFTKLELSLLSAIREKQVDAAEQMLSPNFAWSLALEGRPNAVMSRSEWLKGSDYYDLTSFEIGNLSALALGKVAVVHFRFTISGTMGRASVTGGYVVTDVWEKAGNDWKLVRRFVSGPVPPPKTE